MVKVKGRPSRPSYQPLPEPSECSYASENDTFLTAKTNQPSFVSAEATFTTGSNNAIDDETLLESDTVVPLQLRDSVLLEKNTRSSRISQYSKSVMDVNNDQNDEILPIARITRSTKRHSSAENVTKRLSGSTDDIGLKVLESTPTDHAAAKRKLAGSEPARKLMVINLSPIATMPSTVLSKAKSENAAPQNDKVAVDTANNDTICITSSAKKKSAKKVSKVAFNHATTGAVRNAVNVAIVNRKPLASSKSLVPQKKVNNEPTRKLTVPTSPKFATSQRAHLSKPVDYESLEEREMKLAEEMKKHRFKAQPVPRNVLKAPPVGTKLDTKKPVANVNLKVKSDVHPASTGAGASMPTVSSKTISSKMKENVKQKPEQKNKVLRMAPGGVHKKKSTEARTPNFKMSDRIRQKNDLKKLSDMASRAREQAKLGEAKEKRDRFMKLALRGSKTIVAAPAPAITKPAPFSFAESDRQRKEIKEHKINEYLLEEKRKREFKANPLPNLNAIIGLPEKDVKPSTVPQPFSLATEDRSAAAHTTWSTTIDSSTLETEEQRVFRARPMPDLSVPFVPEKSHKEPTEPQPFVLHTAERVEDRKPFEEALKAREQELEEAKRQRAIEEEEEERRAALELRKSMVHIANPIRHYKPTIIEHHRIPPTIPESPALATRTRAQLRAAAVAMTAAREEEENALNDSRDTYVVDK